jgi:5-methylcytosine-specific restriction protein A
MPRKISRAAMVQRMGRGRKVKVVLPLEPVVKAASQGAARAPTWQDRISRKAQAEQLQREPMCRLCAAKGKQVRATEVDHVTPRHAGGSMTDPANLRSVCHDHHVDLTLADRARRTGRPVRRRPRIKIDPATGLPLPGQAHWWSEDE